VRIVRRLGSQFIAFLSGAVLATGLATLTTLLLQDQRPALYGLVFGSAVLVILGGVVAGWVSIITGDLESLESHEDDASEKDEIWKPESTRITVLLAGAAALTVGGLALLPVRLVWKGWKPQCVSSAAATRPTLSQSVLIPCRRSR
jgi:MFS family permease